MLLSPLTYGCDRHRAAAAFAEAEAWAAVCDDYALRFIQEHAARLPPERVLAAVPPTTYFKPLAPFFRTVLPQQARPTCALCRVLACCGVAY